MIRALANRALDLVFPPRCVSCGTFGSFLCDDCLSSSPRADGERCDRCWTPLAAGECTTCRTHPPEFAGLRSAFVYGGAPKQAVRAFKFSGVSSLAPTMAYPMIHVVREWQPPVDAIVPVPLASMRGRTRGYNQSELLAREISRATGILLIGNAVKRRATSAQSRQANADARRRNVAGAFTPTGKPVPSNVLLVDDVAATCATLDACTRALLAGGAKRVFCLTFARED